MRLINWNCRELGNLRTVRDLCLLIKEKCPKMVFLMETKLRKERMEKIRCKLGFQNLFAMDSVGKGGGLALLWGEEVVVEIQNYRCRHINGKVVEPSSNLQWKFTGFYGHLDVNRRFEAWELLCHLARLSPEPWLCLGDFNKVATNFEKLGGGAKFDAHLCRFQSALEFCELTYLDYKGPKYTWTNCRDGKNFIKEKLDRGMANSGWRDLYPDATIEVKAVTTSDHAIQVVHVFGHKVKQARVRRFRYEACWAEEKGYQEAFLKAWNTNWVGEDLWGKVG
jgi:hypothetical protein